LADTTTLAAPNLPARELLEELARRLGEADDRRRQAILERLVDMALPDRSVHLWRFTDPETLLPESWEGLAREAPAADRAADLAGAAAVVSLAPGRAPRVELGEAARRAGLVAVPLAEASGADLALADGLDDDGFFPRLNAAAWNAGLLLRVPDGTRLEAPVHVVCDAVAPLSLPRLVLLAGRSSEVTLLEEHRGDARRVLGATLLSVGAGARVRHLLVQRWDDDVAGYLHRRARLERDAGLLTAFAVLGGGRTKLEIASDLAGAGARSEMIGVALADGGGRHLDQHTRHRHLAPRTGSDIDFRTVAAGRGRVGYTGLIRIEEQATGAEAYQQNRNLLLSDGARADTIPELEILNEDVSCSHGATVAPVDPDQLFYLQSRGLDPDAALRLVVRGFLEPTLSRLPDGVRASLDASVLARIESWQEAV